MGGRQIPNLDCLCVAFSRDGRAILSGWSDGKIRCLYNQNQNIQTRMTRIYSHTLGLVRRQDTVRPAGREADLGPGGPGRCDRWTGRAGPVRQMRRTLGCGAEMPTRRLAAGPCLLGPPPRGWGGGWADEGGAGARGAGRLGRSRGSCST